MEMVDITKSSNIAQVGHDPENNKLHVKFNNGSVYEYDDVPYVTYLELLQAESAGRYLNGHIKPNHSVRKLEPAG